MGIDCDAYTKLVSDDDGDLFWLEEDTISSFSLTRSIHHSVYTALMSHTLKEMDESDIDMRFLEYDKESIDKLIQFDINNILGASVTRFLIKCIEAMKEDNLDKIYLTIG